VDPLYALRLGDPSRPSVAGELKIPGYSDYLHPVDDETLLGIGQAGDDNGVLRGVKLALFNISDLARPQQGATLELGGAQSYTPVSDDHKALLFDRTRRLLVLPVTEKHGWACDAPPSFHGAKAFTLENDGFVLRAAIEHGPNRSRLHSWPQGSHESYACAQDACAAAAVRRALYIGDDLYTVSDNELRATSLTTFTEAWRTPLHHAEVLAAEGTCTLDGAPLPWLRVAASSDDIYCEARYSSVCRPADVALRRRVCSSAGSGSFSALLSNAVAPCGNASCVPPENVSYHPCHTWFG